MTIIAILIVMIFCYYSTKNTITIIDFIVPYIFRSEDSNLIEEEVIEQIVEITKYIEYIKNSIDTLFVAASYIEHATITCIDFYKNTKFKTFVYDVYHYFRYDFVSTNRFFLKVIIFSLVFAIPLAIYESYEFGFPKEYLYIIPFVLYSALGWYYSTIHLDNFINYVKNSWFFTKDLYIPEIASWEEYIYLTGRESYFLTKLKIFYIYALTESIDLPQIELWEDYVYESDHRSIVHVFYEKYIKPKLKWPKIKWPKKKRYN